MNETPEKRIILGTAGHIDHGKTSLILAVTGVNTDRLKEEQKRGITIELGFASLRLPGGRHLGIVDVPGHEKFVKNMVAGATGIDLVAMVIAADEGVMPQTREHLEICSLLGIRHGLIVLTKIDLVDEEWLELVSDDIREAVRETFLKDAPMIPVSSRTGKGIEGFVEAVGRISESIPRKKDANLFRLPVDRVFTMKGFGTVITGSLVSGRIRVGDPVMIYPSGRMSRVRGIQFHNQSVDEARAGMRTAVNFQGLDKDEVNRGDVLAGPDTLINSYMQDISLNYLKSNAKSIKNRTRVRLHTGTSEVLGNLILLDRDELIPGDRCVSQLRLDAPLALVRDDRFVVRSYSPVRTIGGGRVLNPVPPKHKRLRPDVIELLSGLDRMTSEEMVNYHVLSSGITGVDTASLRLMANLTGKELDNVLSGLRSRNEILLLDKENQRYIHQKTTDRISTQLADLLTVYHGKNPMKAGMGKQELRTRLSGGISGKLFTLALNRMTREGKMVQEDRLVRLKGHRISFAVGAEDLREKIVTTLKKSGLTPPYARDLPGMLGVDPKAIRDILMLLVNEGRIVKTRDDLYFDADAVRALEEKTIIFLKENGEMKTPEFKKIAGLSRKYLIPLIEYFDTNNVTIRVGDVRKLRKGA